MKKFLILLLCIGSVQALIAQDRAQLDEVVVVAYNYRYLSAVDNSEAPVPIQRLEREVADFQVTETDAYLDDFDTYTVSFAIPDGKIVAVYDNEGEIIKTIERFNDFQLPASIISVLKTDFPKWTIVKDVYKVSYNSKTGAKKLYKIKLKNGKETIRIRMNGEGNYL